MGDDEYNGEMSESFDADVWSWDHPVLAPLKPLLAPNGQVEEAYLSEYFNDATVYEQSLTNDTAFINPIVEVLRRSPDSYGYAFVRLFQQRAFSDEPTLSDDVLATMARERPATLLKWLQRVDQGEDPLVQLDALEQLSNLFPTEPLPDIPDDSSVAKWLKNHSMRDVHITNSLRSSKAEAWISLGERFLRETPEHRNMSHGLIRAGFFSMLFKNDIGAFQRIEHLADEIPLNFLMGPLLEVGGSAVVPFHYMASVVANPNAASQAIHYAARIGEDIWNLANIDLPYLEKWGSMEIITAMATLLDKTTNRPLRERLKGALLPEGSAVPDLYASTVLPALVRVNPHLAAEMVDLLPGDADKWQSLLFGLSLHPSWGIATDVAESTSKSLFQTLSPERASFLCRSALQVEDMDHAYWYPRLWSLVDDCALPQKNAIQKDEWPVVSVLVALHDMAEGSLAMDLSLRARQNPFREIPLLKFLHTIWPEHDSVWRAMAVEARDMFKKTLDSQEAVREFGKTWLGRVGNVLMPGKICTFQEHTNLIELVGYPTTPAYYLSVVQREHALLNLALPLDGVQSHFMDAPPA